MVPKPLWFERCPPSLSPPILTACRGGTGQRCNPADLVSITAQEQLTTVLLKCEKEQQKPLCRRAKDPCLSVRAGFRLPSASSPGALARSARERGERGARGCTGSGLAPRHPRPICPAQPRRHPPSGAALRGARVCRNYPLPRALCTCFPSVLN